MFTPTKLNQYSGIAYILNIATAGFVKKPTFGSVNAVYIEDTIEPVYELNMQLTGMEKRKNQKQI